MNPNIESTDIDPMMQGEPVLPELPLSPQARLDASRAALRHWIDRTYHPERLQPEPPVDAYADDVAPEDEPAWLGLLVDSLSDVPVASMAVRYLRRWWSRHPLKATAAFATTAGRDLLGPAAARHPWLLLGGAALAGAAVTRLRPWRWVSGSALMTLMVPPISLASVLASVTAMAAGLQGEDEPEGPVHPPHQPGFEMPARPVPAAAAADERLREAA
ncbi:hypothetical protein [Rhizobacter sp. LjRoot28]|jgi:hypothetical protein|uniref:hypothetical protein n=1 Tax=Rhizobacter sp. LjRoot28 TaxID=3342309 RepID=UPI003ED16806